MPVVSRNYSDIDERKGKNMKNILLLIDIIQLKDGYYSCTRAILKPTAISPGNKAPGEDYKRRPCAVAWKSLLFVGKPLVRV